MKTTLGIGAAIIVGVLALGAWSERNLVRAIGADDHAAAMVKPISAAENMIHQLMDHRQSRVSLCSAGDAGTSQGYAHLSGEVRNDGQELIDSLEAVATFRTRGGTFVKAADALIEYRPLMPGQVSPFLVLTTWNPMISGCQVAFKTYAGGEVSASQ